MLAYWPESNRAQVAVSNTGKPEAAQVMKTVAAAAPRIASAGQYRASPLAIRPVRIRAIVAADDQPANCRSARALRRGGP